MSWRLAPGGRDTDSEEEFELVVNGALDVTWNQPRVSPQPPVRRPPNTTAQGSRLFREEDIPRFDGEGRPANEAARALESLQLPREQQRLLAQSLETPDPRTLRADTGEGVGTIAISVTDNDGFLIEAVNAIDSTKRTALEATLLELSMKDAKELRKMYKDRLRSGPPEGSEGAGLGFIEMARRVQRFEFEIADTENGPVFVYRGYVS